jgi:hypothetical protein
VFFLCTPGADVPSPIRSTPDVTPSGGFQIPHHSPLSNIPYV